MVFEISCNNEIPVFQSKAHTQTPHPPLNFTIYHSTFYHFNTYNLHYFIQLSSILLVNRIGPPPLKQNTNNAAINILVCLHKDFCNISIYK